MTEEEKTTSVEDLPKSMVRRLVKDKLGDITVLREALDAFSESSRIFIHYLSAALVSSLSSNFVYKLVNTLDA